jgi:branched-chain amino acid transport system substrate-binding protein
MKVAFFEDTSIDEPYQHVLPAEDGLRLAILKEAGAPGSSMVEIAEFETKGDPETAVLMARDVAADPTYVAAIAAPFWQEPASVSRVFQEAGVPVLSLSTLGTPAGSGAGGLQMVPPLQVQVSTLSSLITRTSPGGACLVTDDSAFGAEFGREAGASLQGLVALGAYSPDEPQAAVNALVGRIRADGCASILWGGFESSAAALRLALSESGLAGVGMLGPDAIRTGAYLATSGSDGQGTVASCACVDLSTSTSLPDQVFIHDYQSEFGTAPGMYSVEAWDAGGMILAALAGGETRALVRSNLLEQHTYTGLAGTYSFDESGSLVRARSHVEMFTDDGGRWVRLGEREGTGVAAKGVASERMTRRRK